VKSVLRSALTVSENLRIQLLGRFEVWRDGAPIPPAEWRGQKPRDLLKILLLARGRLVSNDQLCEWLWPDSDPAAALVNLRSTVSDLRKLLEPGLVRGRDSAFILTRHEGYAYDLDAPALVDAFEFEQTLAASTRPELQTVLARYPGELLEEDLYAGWAMRERERMSELLLEALARLADLCLAETDYPAAISVCEQALALDASRETLWRGLMRAHALSGDRAAALRTFDRCRAALARDLGVDPLPETVALHEQILRTEPIPPPFPIREGGVALPSPLRGGAGGEVWLYRLGAAGNLLWVLLTGTSFFLLLAGLLRGTVVSWGNPGGDALPYLLSHPEALSEIHQRIYVFIPLGLLLLPGYLAWFAALRSEGRAQGRAPTAAAWLGVSLGGLEVFAQTLSRTMSLAQLTVLPPAYAAAEADQRLVLITFWDVLRQFASAFGVISETAHPIALGLLCWAAREHSRFSPWLIWPGLGLAGLTLLYSFFAPGAALGSWGLYFSLALPLASYAWLIALAGTLWRIADSKSLIADG